MNGGARDGAAGAFVVLEGGDGSGKSTQARMLAARLRAARCEVVETFEPGATATGARIRAMLLDDLASVVPVAEALLMAADRAQHVAEVVRPALARGVVVVCDRYVPSSLAYQGIARGLGVEAVAAASAWATGDLEPDVVVVFDVDDATARARLTRVAEGADRLEREGDGFHADVHDAYRKLAAERGWVIVDGTGSPDEVAARVWAVVSERLGVARSR